MLSFSKSSISNTFDCKNTYHLFIIAFSITMVGLFIEIGNTIPMHLIQAQIGNGSRNTQISSPENNNFSMSGPLNQLISSLHVEVAICGPRLHRRKF